MHQYAVVNYDDRPNDDNEIHIIHVTDNCDYANKLAFHYAKKGLPPKGNFDRTECRILKNYCNEDSTIYLRDVIVNYRIGEVEYDDECEDYEKYDITDVWHNVWAVVHIYNDNIDIGKIKDIDETLIYKN